MFLVQLFLYFFEKENQIKWIGVDIGGTMIKLCLVARKRSKISFSHIE